MSGSNTPERPGNVPDESGDDISQRPTERIPAYDPFNAPTIPPRYPPGWNPVGPPWPQEPVSDDEGAEKTPTVTPYSPTLPGHYPDGDDDIADQDTEERPVIRPDRRPGHYEARVMPALRPDQTPPPELVEDQLKEMEDFVQNGPPKPDATPDL